MSRNLGTIYYEVDARTGKLLTAGKQADDAFDRIERGAMKADSGVKKLNTQLTKTSAAVKTNLSPAIRNASYQIADLATQLQMGGNALQAFAVQGAQLLAGFGTMGAVAGRCWLSLALWVEAYRKALIVQPDQLSTWIKR